MVKARNGDGSITSRKTATKGVVWDVQMTIKDRRGLSHRVSKRGLASEKAAVAWRDAQKARAKAGKGLRTPALTMPQLCAKYIEATRLAPTTREMYESNLRCWIKPHLDVRVQNLNGERYQAFTDLQHELATEQGRTGSGSIKNCRALVIATLRWACSPDIGLLAENPLESSRWSNPATSQKRRSLTRDEVRRLLEVSTVESGAVWRLFLDTAMRRGELVARGWADLDFETRILDINSILTRSSNGGFTVAPRTKRGAGRKAYLSEAAIANLRALREASGTGGHQYIFEAAGGDPMAFHTIFKWWRRDAEAAGLQGLVVHDLRRTWATRALEAGVQPNVVSEIMGHTNIATTLAYYRHVSTDEMRAAMELVSKQIA